MAGIYIPLQPKEKQALIRLAESEFRYPREQALLIIRKELERRGYLSDEQKSANEQKVKGTPNGC